MPDTAERETVSIEAHRRMTAERDELKAKVEQLSATVTDYGYADRAEAWFNGKVSDPKSWADIALPHIRDGELDTIDDVLEAKFGDRLPPITTDPPEAIEPTEEPVAIETPRPSVAGPNPAAPGEPVTADLPQVVFNDSEYRKVIAKEGLAGIRRLQSEGRFTPSRR